MGFYKQVKNLFTRNSKSLEKSIFWVTKCFY